MNDVVTVGIDRRYASGGASTNRYSCEVAGRTAVLAVWSQRQVDEIGYPATLDHRRERGMPQTTVKGSCLCGAVKYEVTGEPKRFYDCHCSRCRKATGTGHASNLFLQPGALKWLSGEQEIRAFKVPEAKRFTNTFCATCASRLPRQPKDATSS